MTFIVNFFIAVYSLAVIFDIIRLLTHKKNPFEIFSFPLGICCAVMAVVEIIVLKKGVVEFIIVTVLFIITFIIERIRENINIKDHININYVNIEECSRKNKPLFSLMYAYSEAKMNNETVLLNLLEKHDVYRNAIEGYFNKSNLVISHLDNYIQLQMDDCANLLKIKTQCETIFPKLKKSATSCNKAFTDFSKNLDKTNASFECFRKGESIYDIMKSLADDSGKITRLIDVEIIPDIHSIKEKNSGFKEILYTFFNDTIEFCTYKVATTLDSIDEKYRKNVMNQEGIIKEFEKISDALSDYGKKMDEIVGKNGAYLNKNLFVLSKILETYRQ